MRLQKPLIIAHRGFSARYPENTLAAIRAAIRLGVDMVEVDVQETADGELVVFHDYRLDRIYGVRQRVRDALREDLPDAPTLAEVLRLNFPLLVEIKGANPEKVSALVRGRRDVIVFSLRPGKISRMTGATRFGLAVDLAKARDLPFVAGWGLSRRFITKRIIDRLHRHGQTLFVWTVNRPAEMRRLAEWGVDGLITDHPDRALQLFS